MVLQAVVRVLCGICTVLVSVLVVSFGMCSGICVMVGTLLIDMVIHVVCLSLGSFLFCTKALAAGPVMRWWLAKYTVDGVEQEPYESFDVTLFWYMQIVQISCETIPMVAIQVSCVHWLGPGTL